MNTNISKTSKVFSCKNKEKTLWISKIFNERTSWNYQYFLFVIPNIKEKAFEEIQLAEFPFEFLQNKIGEFISVIISEKFEEWAKKWVWWYYYNVKYEFFQ